MILLPIAVTHHGGGKSNPGLAAKRDDGESRAGGETGDEPKEGFLDKIPVGIHVTGLVEKNGVAVGPAENISEPGRTQIIFWSMENSRRVVKVLVAVNHFSCGLAETGKVLFRREQSV